MDPAKRKTLDQILRRQRLKTGLRMATALIPVLLVLAFLTFDPPRDGEVLKGRIVGLGRGPVMVEHSAARWMVELESGIRVSVNGTAHLPFEMGRRVLVRERVGMIFGNVSYEFHGYADGTDG